MGTRLYDSCRLKVLHAASCCIFFRKGLCVSGTSVSSPDKRPDAREIEDRGWQQLATERRDMDEGSPLNRLGSHTGPLSPWVNPRPNPSGAFGFGKLQEIMGETTIRQPHVRLSGVYQYLWSLPEGRQIPCSTQDCSEAPPQRSSKNCRICSG